MKFNLNFETDYGQFYLNDKKPNGKTNSDCFWTDTALEDKLAIEEGILGILIGKQEGIVNCEFEILQNKSTISNFDNSDHIVEGSLKINSGVLQITDCPFSTIELETKIENGEYRVRIYSQNLESVETDEPKDFYKIEMWKEEFNERIVLKRYHK
tara:strand:+ start:56 stop:520 length:465 start_codon:yes stop_codon:yes gene_type:complete